MPSITSSADAPNIGSPTPEKSLLRQRAYTSKRWRSIRIRSRRKASWRTCSRSAAGTDGPTRLLPTSGAEELVGQALAASPRDWLAHYAKGALRRWQGRCDEAVPEFETAIALNPNWLNSLDQLAWCKLLTGSIEEAVPLDEQAIRLSPRDPYIYNYYYTIGLVHLLQSRTDEAIVWFEKAHNVHPGFPHSSLASAYALKGETERATAELAEARRLDSTGRFTSIASLRAAGTQGGPGYWGVPKIGALFDATYFAGLRKAGMPEE
jgi:tetratricopeptide (TPR) repeat protein